MSNTLVFGALPCNEVLGFARAPQLDYGAPETTPGVLGAILVESGATAAIWAPRLYFPDDFLTATQGSYALACAAADVGLKRLVLISTMQLFSRIPQNWHLGTNWRPRPGRGAPTLFPFLTELSVQEVARATGLRVTVLRLGDVSREEAAEAVRQSLNDTKSWVVRHVGDAPGRPETDGGKPWREILGPVEPIASREAIRKVVILGAGGPIGRTVADALKDHYTLRLADIAPLAEAKPQDPKAPIARPLPAPHEEVHLDVRQLRSVTDACKDCDAIINLTVVRQDFAGAFAVNALGAWNVGQAAAIMGIRRVVHTGPQLITLHGESDFLYDYHLASDTPTRPGRHLYGHSKFLGNEAMRVLAEWYDLEVPNLMFNGFAQPDAVSQGGCSAMMLTWQDAARAIKCALEAPSLPSPYEEFHCVADFPHDQCHTDKAQRLLGWKPHDTLEGLWRRP
ncbi:NAD-dependent epimerase/dehydratase family protein [Armatimonas sp.]|uniref:NAD-dependent epimerase/dehydratase family protein n=1 Tax=Armatimonas sp. TaxID=1872638 RepID=UPI00286C7AB0|nr:NAD-dependent epimerase/dehydratase family protein [Armatimonas sp.]